MSPEAKRFKDRYIQRATAGGVRFNYAEGAFTDEYGRKGELINSFDNPETAADNLIHDLDAGIL